jgi:ABC-type multidrug transport system fused ATPase/permease subunit
MKGKTRILVTHQLHFLPKVDYVILMKEGKIAEQGTYQDLLNIDGEFSTMMKSYGGVIGDEADITDAISDNGSERNAATQRIENTISDMKMNKSHELMTTEERVVGKVNRAIWWMYLKASGGSRFLVALLMSLSLIQLCRLGTDIWLVQWMENKIPHFSLHNYISVYLVLGILQALSSYSLGIVFAYSSTRAARILHQGAGRRILRAPMSFFDTTPLGRIINRFSKDLGTLFQLNI